MRNAWSGIRIHFICRKKKTISDDSISIAPHAISGHTLNGRPLTRRRQQLKLIVRNGRAFPNPHTGYKWYSCVIFTMLHYRVNHQPWHYIIITRLRWWFRFPDSDCPYKWIEVEMENLGWHPLITHENIEQTPFVVYGRAPSPYTTRCMSRARVSDSTEMKKNNIYFIICGRIFIRFISCWIISLQR